MKTKKKGPLSDLSKEQLTVMASDIRSTIMTTVLKNGGHLSSNLGTVELTMSLLCHFDPLKDDILFDVGHQTYAYKILTGKDLSSLRQYGGETPFTDRFSSPYDKYNNGHAGTSLAVAYGMAKAKMLNGDNSMTIAVIGDSSIVNGLAQETLNTISEDHSTPMIILVNDNDMSISRHVGHIHRNIEKIRNSRFYFRTSSNFGRLMSKHQKTYKLFLKLRSLKDHFRNMLLSPTVYEAMGLRYIGPIDGHDFSALDLGFEKAKLVASHGPVVLHVVTKKGYGYKEAMEDKEGIYHGVDPDFDEKTPSDSSFISFTSMKLAYLKRKMDEDASAVLITPAMETGSKLTDLFSLYPNRCFDVGIAEEEAVTFASGFALKGYHPYVDIYSTFLQRSFDEIIEDVSRERIQVMFFVERAGLTGQDGESHQGIYDVALMRSIPYAKVYMPFSVSSFEKLLSLCDSSHVGPLCLRIPKDLPVKSNDSMVSNTAQFIRKGSSDTLIVAVGPKGYELGIECSNADLLMLTDLLPSKVEFLSFAEGYSNILLLDPYSVKEGTDSYLRSLLLNYSIQFQSLSLPMDFIPHGKVDELYMELGFTKEHVNDMLSSFRTKKEENHNINGGAL